MSAGYLNLLLIMFRGLSSGKFIQLYEVGTCIILLKYQLCLATAFNSISFSHEGCFRCSAALRTARELAANR